MCQDSKNAGNMKHFALTHQLKYGVHVLLRQSASLKHPTKPYVIRTVTKMEDKSI